MGKCKAGQYIKLTIPSITRFETHPFTLSGCPEDGVLQLHIKSLGDWTRRVYDLAVQDELESCKIHVVGPFVTRTSEVANYANLVLVGAGVGATPFTSVLESMLKKSSMEDRCVDFHWIVGNQQAARSWFPGLLQSIEDCSSDLSIRVTIWYTGGRMLHSATQKGLFDFSNFLYREKLGKEILTGIRVKNLNVAARFGRPCWKAVLHSHMKMTTITKPIGVFCCGPQGLVQDVNSACDEMSSKARPVNFHCEHFNSW